MKEVPGPPIGTEDLIEAPGYRLRKLVVAGDTETFSVNEIR